MFFHSDYRTQVPLSRVSHARDLGKTTHVKLKDGETVEVDSASWSAATRDHLIHVSPAALGTYTLNLGTEDLDSGAEPLKTLVIAWGFAADGGVYPVTVSGVNDALDGMQTILHPDGTVEVPNQSTFATMEQWRTDLASQKRSS